jgi:SAM-dependent methyltransferase
MNSHPPGTIDPETISRQTYSTLAAREIYRQKAIRAELKKWEQVVVDANMAPGSGVHDVLAVGCGSGREVFALERHGCMTVGVDISAELIHIAKEEAHRRASGSAFALIDGVTLPFAPSTFDAVVLWAQVLGHVPGSSARLGLLAEVRRVMRHRGFLSLSVHDRARTLPLLEASRIVGSDTPEPGDLIITEPAINSISYMRYFDEPEIRSLLSTAGFSDITIAHTDELGESWGNVFVVTATAT